MTEKKARRLPPRKKGGVFGTSKAQAKRRKEGLPDVPKNRTKAVGGNARALKAAAPLTDPVIILEGARAAAQDQRILKPTIQAFKSAESKALAELRSSLIASAPRAAAYLSDLVDGLHDEAPHAVRAGAASKLIDSALEIAANGNVNKDLAEMDYADLQAEVSRLANELGARGADDAEVVADVIRPARRTLE